MNISELLGPPGKFINEPERLFINCLVKFLEIYAQEFVGEVDIDYDRVLALIKSGYFRWDLQHDFKSEDDCMWFITDMAETGVPMWKFLILENDLQRSIFE